MISTLDSLLIFNCHHNSISYSLKSILFDIWDNPSCSCLGVRSLTRSSLPSNFFFKLLFCVFSSEINLLFFVNRVFKTTYNPDSWTPNFDCQHWSIYVFLNWKTVSQLQSYSVFISLSLHFPFFHAQFIH